MKTPQWFPSFSTLVAPLAALVLLSGAPDSRAQPFTAGTIITTNLGLQNRFRWTNDNGQVFTPSNTTLRLSDFDGKIVFFSFFDVW